jgi:hypothetical protein
MQRYFFYIAKENMSRLVFKNYGNAFLTATKKAVTLKGNSSGIIHYKCLLVNKKAVFTSFLQTDADAFFVDGTQCRSRNFERYPFVFFRNKEAFGLKIRVKPAFGFNI